MARIHEHQTWLSSLAQASTRKRNAMVRLGKKKEMDLISECCYNVLKGRPRLTPEQKLKLKKYRNVIRYLAKPRTAWQERQAKIVQNGGFLPMILGPIISGVAGIIGSLISRRP